MALRKIICIEDELLRKKSRPVEKFDEKLHKLLDDMAETMYNANGVGLAAPQVAVLRRVVVMDCGDGLIEMINPEILETEGEQDGPEGCLSVPGRRGMVKRPMKVRAKFQDRNGEWYEIEAEELLARCIMHETDHLNGQLYVDIMSRELFDDDGLSSLRRAQGRRVLGGVHFIQRKRFAQRRARQQRKRQQQGEETIAHPSYLISIRRLNSYYSTERAKTQSSGAGEGAAAG